MQNQQNHGCNTTGSLTPDFEYFLRMEVQSNFSHTILGIFWLPNGFGSTKKVMMKNQC
ncbi:DUF4184 family protein [Pedobacter sp. GR22-6]|uniref:DUF4184 family protein n=1 Tax=Pedobacter sp. GR22-6 TaxID=3127957 RepID=UPI003FCCAD1F